ncbi:DUF4097 family beta strand repeat-containing protein [Streptomyces sp. SID5910]|uniref:DUF4097 family beta strand repeat-containing protein n=1 Tax=Streptomyces sp. SID5910 TaxID=2690312 RepID=UPI00136CFBF5|nr:DUF4097 family beta strand repeat-containing protein [Streptomyces sp. SID5910]MYR41790.1 DUF4097 family beta strand repeat protein [Streptomyces sp. SID5910]
MARRTVTARGLAAAGTVAVLVAGLGACASADEDKDPDHKTFALPGSTLTVDADDSALEIVAADEHAPGKIEVTRWFKGSVVVGSDPEVSWSMDGDRLKLRMKCSGVVADCAAKHRVEVPRGVTVAVKTDDGSVRASGFRDPLDIRTADGSVRVGDTTGPLTLHSDDGSLRADVSSRRVEATTKDGSIRLALGTVPDRVETRSDDGSVTVDLPPATYKVSADSDDGSVHVSVPRNDTSTHVVTARTQDGKVTVRTAN